MKRRIPPVNDLLFEKLSFVLISCIESNLDESLFYSIIPPTPLRGALRYRVRALAQTVLFNI
jgi:hypothetical protein